MTRFSGLQILTRSNTALVGRLLEEVGDELSALTSTRTSGEAIDFVVSYNRVLYYRRGTVWNMSPELFAEDVTNLTRVLAALERLEGDLSLPVPDVEGTQDEWQVVYRSIRGNRNKASIDNVMSVIAASGLQHLLLWLGLILGTIVVMTVVEQVASELSPSAAEAPVSPPD